MIHSLDYILYFEQKITEDLQTLDKSLKYFNYHASYPKCSHIVKIVIREVHRKAASISDQNPVMYSVHGMVRRCSS